MNDCFKIGIFIHDEEAIMTVLEELMFNFEKLRQEWNDEVVADLPPSQIQVW